MSENHILQVMPDDECNSFRATVISPPAEADLDMTTLNSDIIIQATSREGANLCVE